MHSTQGPSSQWYAHNGDYSGAVKASIPVRAQARYPDNYTSASKPHAIAGEEGEFVEVEIPFEDIRALYLAYVRQTRISRLEQAEDAELEAELIGTRQTPAQPVSVPTLEDWGTLKRQQAAATQEEKRITQHWTRLYLRETDSYHFPHPGRIYVHSEQPWVLARVDETPVDGSVLFAVWNPVQGYGWQSGAGLKSQDEFRELYSLQYTGPGPETLPRP